MNMKHRIISTTLGLTGIAVPAELINHFTHNVNSTAVIMGVMAASLVGYGFGAWCVAAAYDYEQEKQESCACPREDVVHDYDCPEVRK